MTKRTLKLIPLDGIARRVQVKIVENPRDRFAKTLEQLGPLSEPYSGIVEASLAAMPTERMLSFYSCETPDEIERPNDVDPTWLVNSFELDTLPSPQLVNPETDHLSFIDIWFGDVSQLPETVEVEKPAWGTGKEVIGTDGILQGYETLIFSNEGVRIYFYEHTNW